MKKKIRLYGYTLGDSPRDCKIDQDDIHSMFWKTKKEAKMWMKKGMKDAGWPCGAIVRVTIEKVKV